MTLDNLSGGGQSFLEAFTHAIVASIQAGAEADAAGHAGHFISPVGRESSGKMRSVC